ncbi:hypothetical protein B7R54_09705 [Subtercola boreus]|uniref:Uncharacterized protein n=1 Tax=Subtercola boreus TaxID=120213 RepID=A0A3E0VJ15_9MICO|nr:hypothetical protein [Subtercola boreus]RFA09473.1 hypothetical protein B7R54_09705 [Subtercola boreus]TQL53476.1 hypothetical protein FB464_0986 [Subtercola boreus]
MKAVRLLKIHRRAQKLVETEAEASVKRDVEHGFCELGRLRRRGTITETEFVTRRAALLLPVVQRPVLD